MSNDGENTLSWEWIKSNWMILAMFGALVTGGVETRVTLAQALSEGREHREEPHHDEMGTRMAVTEAQNAFINKRLDGLEDGQKALNTGVAGLNATSKATLEQLKRLNERLDAQ